MEKKRIGNPAWVKGKSPNPKGRPRGQTSLMAYYNDPLLFEARHVRWWKFALEYILWAGRGAKAARNAGYSTKSARSIASRLKRKLAVRAMISEIGRKHNLGSR